MSVSPSKILNQLSVDDNILVDDLEKKIDEYLIKHFVGLPVYYTCAVSDRILRELQKRYSDWELSRYDGGYNESMLRFASVVRGHID